MRKVHSDKIKCQAIGWWTKYPAFSHDDSKVTCRYCLNALRSQRIKETDPEKFYRRYDYGILYICPFCGKRIWFKTSDERHTRLAVRVRCNRVINENCDCWKNGSKSGVKAGEK